MDKTDKVRFNNEIILMRKDVKKAKTYISQKLIRNIKNLKKKVAKKQVESFQRKIDKLDQELSIIKKLGADEISKFVLGNKKMPGEIMTNAQSNITDQVFARFCANKIIIAQVDKMKAEFPNLDDLLSNLQQRKLKQKINSVKKKNANNVKEGHNVQDDLPQSSGGRLLLINKNTRDSNNSSDEVSNESMSEHSENESGADSETDDSNMDSNVQTKPISHNSSSKNIPSSELKSKKRKINTGIEENKKPKTEVDPFFLTDKGEYESSIVKDTVSPEPSSNKQTKTYGNNGNFKSKPSWKGQPHREMNFSKKKFKDNGFQSKGGKNNKNFKKEKGPPVHLSTPNKIEKIHPSWEAKKKEKEKLQSIHTFQGKKKTFDDV